ncbi:growth hormone secretagogue receptor type 1-like isoform X3 [Apostichopus japonicus]|uniref:growth hormone secretagogue receptor type 1-like isoform X3 n=1 Tax=Stichopus japonicus TaxID=307972 RepID=UPI003AB1FA3D
MLECIPQVAIIFQNCPIAMAEWACNLTLLELNYTDAMGQVCDDINEPLVAVCHSESQDIPCSSAYPGRIIEYCIQYCSTCPYFLYDMDHDTRMVYLEPTMGAPGQRNGLFFSMILAILCIFGSIANILTIIVILRNKVLQATSHYLLSLALSDLLMLLTTAPVEIKFQLHFWPWSFPQFFCRLHPYVKEACLYTTVLHIVAFTIERYIVICHPMRARTILSQSRASKIIVLIWICSFILATPVFAVFSTQEFCFGIPESTVCLPQYELDRFLAIFYGISSIFLFLVPMTLIIVLYSLIARTLYAKNITSGRRTSMMKIPKKTAKKKHSTSDAVDKARHHAVKLLALVAVCFFVLWFPFMWIRLRPLIVSGGINESTYHEWLYSISMTLLYLSSCANPVLYNIMSARFRKAYKRTVLCREIIEYLIWERNRKSLTTSF